MHYFNLLEPHDFVEIRASSVVETTDEGICVRDLEGRFVYVNGAAAAMLGARAEEVIGTRMTDYFDDAASELESFDS